MQIYHFNKNNPISHNSFKNYNISTENNEKSSDISTIKRNYTMPFNTEVTTDEVKYKFHEISKQNNIPPHILSAYKVRNILLSDESISSVPYLEDIKLNVISEFLKESNQSALKNDYFNREYLNNISKKIKDI